MEKKFILCSLPGEIMTEIEGEEALEVSKEGEEEKKEENENEENENENENEQEQQEEEKEEAKSSKEECDEVSSEKKVS